MMKVEISSQVRRFIASLAPDPRKKLRRAIQMLSQHKGDTKPLVEELAGFHRLRSGNFRVIYRHPVKAGVEIVACEFAERREAVYQIFPRTVKDKPASGH